VSILTREIKQKQKLHTHGFIWICFNPALVMTAPFYRVLVQWANYLQAVCAEGGAQRDPHECIISALKGLLSKHRRPPTHKRAMHAVVNCLSVGLPGLKSLPLTRVRLICSKCKLPARRGWKRFAFVQPKYWLCAEINN